MDAQPETTMPIEEKHSFNWQAFILWPCLILLLYGLSIGPFARMQYKGSIQDRGRFVSRFYMPLAWAYHKTFLHKPIGRYLHLWNPKYFDKNGDMPGFPGQ
jgi:hypothetical protein